jgi:hypothetical protein
VALTLGSQLECFEEIARRLVEAVPEPWERIEVEFGFEAHEIDDVCEYTIVYFPARKPRSEKQIFIDDTEFTDCFFQLARFTSTPEKGFYKKCLFILHKDGRYTTNFDY